MSPSPSCWQTQAGGKHLPEATSSAHVAPTRGLWVVVFCWGPGCEVSFCSMWFHWLILLSNAPHLLWGKSSLPFFSPHFQEQVGAGGDTPGQEQRYSAHPPANPCVRALFLEELQHCLNSQPCLNITLNTRFISVARHGRGYAVCGPSDRTSPSPSLPVKPSPRSQFLSSPWWHAARPIASKAMELQCLFSWWFSLVFLSKKGQISLSKKRKLLPRVYPS